MSLTKIKRGIVKNGVLLSLMLFYFSCGKDVFPPDSPGEMSFQINTKTFTFPHFPSPPDWRLCCNVISSPAQEARREILILKSVGF